MTRPPKLKAVLKRALAQQARRPAAPAAARAAPPAQHDPAGMTVRHAWSDGAETETPFRRSRQQKVLVVGDGDLSFSAGLLAHVHGPQVVCTTLDTAAELARKYGPGAAANAALLAAAGATVLHGVDATRLHTNKALLRFGYAKVVFNYPHTGAGIKDRDRNIRAQQQMIRAFLQSAKELLARHRPGLTRTAILRSRTAPLGASRKRAAAKRGRQSDDDNDDDNDGDEEGEQVVDEEAKAGAEILLTVRTGDPYDEWRVKALGNAIEGLRAGESFRFEPAKYAGYRHVRTTGGAGAGDGDGEEADFLARPAKTYVFHTHLVVRDGIC